jgi:hypothetical protein
MIYFDPGCRTSLTGIKKRQTLADTGYLYIDKRINRRAGSEQ